MKEEKNSSFLNHNPCHFKEKNKGLDCRDARARLSTS